MKMLYSMKGNNKIVCSLIFYDKQICFLIVDHSIILKNKLTYVLKYYFSELMRAALHQSEDSSAPDRRARFEALQAKNRHVS